MFLNFLLLICALVLSFVVIFLGAKLAAWCSINPADLVAAAILTIPMFGILKR